MTRPVAAVVLLMLVVCSFHAAAQAPERGTGRLSPPGPVRVIDGDTLEVRLGGGLFGVRLIGIDAPEGNTPCGRKAAALLETLVGNGVTFDEDLDLTFDRLTLRLYYGTAANGASLAIELVVAGLARPDGTGLERAALQAAAREARGRGRECAPGLLGDQE